MSVELQEQRVRYVGNGTARTFPFPFQVEAAAQVQVVLADANGTESILELNSHYTVALNADGTGSVTLAQALPTGYVLALVSNIEISQERAFYNNTPYYQEQIEGGLDKLTRICQQLEERVRRTVKLPATDKRTPEEYAQELIESKYEAQRWAEYAEKQADRTVQIPSESEVLATGSTAPRALQDRFADVVNVKDFGAKGDGVTDDTDAFEAALLAGKHIVIPQGKYRLTRQLRLKDDCVLSGYGAELILSGSGQIAIEGSAADVEIAINRSLHRYDASLGTVTDHNAAVGDDFILVSCVNAISADAGDWQLGIPTEAYHASYFTEPFTVTDVSSSTELGFFPQLSFDHYPATKTTETSEYTKDASVIKKVYFIKNCRVEGLTIDASSSTVTPLSFKWAKNSSVKDVIVKKGSKTGASVVFENSLMCHATTVKTVRSYPMPQIDSVAGAEHHAWNAYKFIGAWSCEFIQCTDEYGSQSFDISYRDYGHPSMFASVKQCTSFAPRYHGITSHSGSYGIVIEDNAIVKARAGIALRSRACICTGNYIECTSPDSVDERGYGIGISLAEGWYVDSLVAENYVTGAIYAVRLMRTQILGTGFMDVRTSIKNNILRDCKHGVCIFNDVTEATDKLSGITIESNDIQSFSGNGVHISSYANGVVISHNKITATNDGAHCVYVDDTCFDSVITNNIFDLQTTNITGVRTPSKSTELFNIYIGPEQDYKKVSPKVSRAFARPVFGVYNTHPVWQNTSGATVLDDLNNAVLTIAASSSKSSVINFGNMDTVIAAGRILYSHASNRFDFRVNNITSLFLSSTNLAPEVSKGLNLGAASKLWSNIYAATDVISTSDAREKTSVTDPNEALMRAWGKVNFKSFQFTDAVEKKDAGARVHFGVIAQQVAEAFASEGLDASRYALFCYDKWDDEYEDVEVVDVKAVLDEEGNEITPAVTHTEKRLVTPTGDRYGIRYSEALALECAYQRWRLDKLEAKLNAAD